MANPAQAKKMTSAKDIARETIKQMAQRRVEPTPINYELIYHELSDEPLIESLESAMSKTLKQLPNQDIEQINWVNRWDKLLKQPSWDGLPNLLSECMDTSVNNAKEWPDTIRQLLRAWQSKSTGQQVRKKESLERVLINFGGDPQLPTKLNNLSKNWLNDAIESTSDTDTTEVETEVVVATIDKELANIVDTQSGESKQFVETFEMLQAMLKQSLDLGLIPRLDGYPELREEAFEVSEKAKQARKLKDWQSMSKQLKALLLRVEMVGANESDIKQDLLGLLKLLINNISELVVEDQWLRGQVATVQTIISGPLDRKQMKDAERSLKEVIHKQSLIKSSLEEAKSAFKKMVSTFVERLKFMTESSGQYQEKIEVYVDELSHTDDIASLNNLLEKLMRDTQTMQTDIVRSHDDLLAQKEESESSQEKILKLQAELSELSEVVRMDQLTGVLNRRGLDDAYLTEISRSKRNQTPLSIALLDIDDFKSLNDNYGHDVGDMALKHLADIVKTTIRPTDVVTRLGGEEFVILLPDTNVDEAVITMTRLQRSLTKKYFLSNNEKLLITFSAGVALHNDQDDQISVIHRADQAMYLAKRSGKNRVMTEQDLKDA